MKFFRQIEYQNAQAATDALKANIATYKVIHLAHFTHDISPERFYEKVSEEIGTVHNTDEDKQTGELTGNRWIDISFDPAEPNRYRSSKTRQPLHTDDSYIPIEGSITFFYCQAQATLGGATTFLDADKLIEALEIDGEQQLLADLRRIPVTFSKASSHKTLPILREDEKGYLLNWNWHCVDEQNTPEAKDLCLRFHQFLEERIHHAGIVLPLTLQPGEAVFFHDERLLHGRYAFFTDAKGGRTLIKGTITLTQQLA